MKAMLVDAQRRLVWSDVAEPVVGAHDVCIEIHAAALNRADLLQRQGKYPSPKGCPPWMGLEVAGVVRETGAAVTESSSSSNCGRYFFFLACPSSSSPSTISGSATTSPLKFCGT